MGFGLLLGEDEHDYYFTDLPMFMVMTIHYADIKAVNTKWYIAVSGVGGAGQEKIFEQTQFYTKQDSMEQPKLFL